MGKKKRGHPDLEELLARPWCYYCERDFDDLKILISHQKAKHFKCERCGRRLNTAGGLSVHMSQVHKESLSQVDNALQNRSSLDIEIFGMEGVPEDILQAHNQRVLQQYQQAEAERRAATGNPAPGTSGGSGQSKKPKFESPSELKKRLAEHKARLAEQAAGGSSGDATPVGAGQSQSTPSGTPYQQPSTPQYTAPQQGTNGSGQEYHYSAPYGQPPNPFPQQQQPGSAVYVSSSGPQGYPLPQYSPPNISSSAYPQVTAPSIVSPVGASPTLPYHHQQPQAMRTHTPPQTIPPTYPARTPSLPPAPGLPQRPIFGAPQVNAFQMQQLHHGQVSVPPSAVPVTTEVQGNRAHPAADAHSESLSASADKLISEAAKQAKELPAKPSPAPGTPEEGAAGKPSKKEKAKSTRLVYSDNEISPEEKLSRLPRYAFVPESRDEAAVEETAVEPAAGSEEAVSLPV
ncbi:hypothetical protein MauCBS54593_007520 [Microsporum audouinii]